MRIVEREDGFSIVPISQNMRPYWSLLQATAEQARAYADERLLKEGHDCGALECPPWADFSV
jgi:hypothetical protein